VIIANALSQFLPNRKISASLLRKYKMDPTLQFVGQYLNPQEIGYINNPGPISAEFANRVLILDYPIKSFPFFACKVLSHMIHYNIQQPVMIVANEAGAILGMMLAVGYTPKEVLGLLVEKKLDVIDLIEGKTKIKGKAHKKVHGAAHKGHRLGERIQELAR
jgi:hypothetical protein